MSEGAGAVRDEIVRPAHREHLPALLAFVDEATARAGVDTATAADLRLVTEEACLNVIEHGYVAMMPGPIRLRVEHGGDRVVVTLEDEAAPFDPAGIAAPDLSASWDERALGGLGWHLINTLMDEVRHERTAGGNRLTLVKRLAP